MLHYLFPSEKVLQNFFSAIKKHRYHSLELILSNAYSKIANVLLVFKKVDCH